MRRNLSSQPQEPNNDSQSADEEKVDPQTFQISVNIGGEVKKISANMDEQPRSIVKRFIVQENVDPKLENTLTMLIAN